MALPHAVVEATLMECAGCLQRFMAQPPLDEVLRPIVVSKKLIAPHPAPASRAVVPIVLPPRSKQRQAVSYSLPVQEQPREQEPIYEAQLLPESQPPAEPYYSTLPDVNPEPSVSVPRKKKKPKRFKKKLRGHSDSSDETSDFGLRLGAGILMFIIMVVIGAVFGVGKFGWIKSNRIVDFNDKVVAILDRATIHITHESAWARSEEGIRLIHAKMKPSVQELAALSVPSEGREFHQAALRYLQRLDRFIGNDLVQLVRQSASGNNPQLEQQMQRLADEVSALEDAVIQAQAEMARRNHFELTGVPSSTIRRRRW